MDDDTKQLTLKPDDLIKMTPSRRGLLRTSLLCLALPMTPFYFLFSLLFSIGYVRIWKTRTGSYGRDALVPLEDLLVFVFLPFVSIIATLGSSYGFYLLTTESRVVPNISSGILVLGITVTAVIETLLIAISNLFRHRSGADVWPFQPDVDPVRAVALIYSWRITKAPTFLPGRYIGAASWADEMAGIRPGDEPGVSFKSAWERFPHSRGDHAALRAIFVAAATWTAGVLWLVWHAQGPIWPFIAIPMYFLATWCLIKAAGSGSMLARYHVQLRWLRRLEHFASMTKHGSTGYDLDLSENISILSGRVDLLSQEIALLLEGIAKRREDALTPSFFRRALEWTSHITRT